jgi:hypothetical protein
MERSGWFIGNEADRTAAAARSTLTGTHIDQPSRSSATPLVGMKNPPCGGDLAAWVPGPTRGSPSLRRRTRSVARRGCWIPPGSVRSRRSRCLAKPPDRSAGGFRRAAGVCYGPVRRGWDQGVAVVVAR